VLCPHWGPGAKPAGHDPRRGAGAGSALPGSAYGIYTICVGDFMHGRGPDAPQATASHMPFILGLLTELCSLTRHRFSNLQSTVDVPTRIESFSCWTVRFNALLYTANNIHVTFFFYTV
jgi:hypothetical protein